MKGRHQLIKGGYVFIFLTNNLIFRWEDTFHHFHRT